jgi:putative ABC transport system permease protein
MEEPEISEIAVRVKDFGRLHEVFAVLNAKLSGGSNKQGKPGSGGGTPSSFPAGPGKQGNAGFDVHTWESLSPFYNIARMIDMMTLFIKIMLVAVVLISIMNVMIMAVYERTREIGTIAAIGTLPGRILSLFVFEGLSLGLLGAVSGTVLGSLAIVVLNAFKVRFSFGRAQGLILNARLDPVDILTIGLIVVAVAVLAGFRPAFRASRLEPVEALRHV